MSGSLYLAWRYLASHPAKTAILIFSITLIIYIPFGLHVMVDRSEQELTSRAQSTPLLIGIRGSPLDLVLSSLYFDRRVPDTFRFEEFSRVLDTGFALPIPIHARLHAGADPIVGTTLEYFEFRQLDVERGHQMTRLGDCVLGASVAAERGVGPGDSVTSSPEGVFDLAGVYPLRMRVTGVLSFAGTPDDRAVFVDVRTAWVIEGLAHGHADLTSADAASGVLRREGSTVIANASVVQYQEITRENIESFHLHDDAGNAPLSAIIAVPYDHKKATLLMGRYEGVEGPCQILQPVTTVSGLLETIFTIQSLVVVALLIVGVATLATAALVFMLSVRLRRREIETMVKIGGSRTSIYTILAAEVGVVFLASALLAAVLTVLTGMLDAELIWRLLS